MIDKRLLTDTVKVELVNTDDEWGKHSYKEAITLKNIRFDRSIIEKQKNIRQNNSTVNKVGVIFIYPKFCDVKVDHNWLEAKVTDDFGIYTVQGFKVNTFQNKIFSFELEVI